MDIEDLSKSQLLLLTILVNFVVSIATGVMTVSLLDQAPTTITQTVNRIVDHTIETVTTQVPSTNKDSAPSTEDLLTSAISANVSHTVTIQYKIGAGAYSKTGVYLPVSRMVLGVSPELPGNVTILFPNGSTFEADRTGQDGNLMRYGFATDIGLPKASTMKLTQSSALKQGQTIIGLTTEGKAVTGIIGKIDSDGIHSDLSTIPPGGVIVNLSGDIIGISGGGGLFLPAERIDALISAS